VIKHVDNTNGGSATASQFQMNVTGTNVNPSSFAGVESPGTTVHLSAGSYSVTESGGPSGNTEADSADCTGSIAAYETKTCTITNTSQLGILVVKKVLVTDNGGTKVVTDFQFKVDNGTATTFTQDSDDHHGKNSTSVTAGQHTVTEVGT